MRKLILCTLYFVVLSLLVACQPPKPTTMEAIRIDASLDAIQDTTYLAMIAPYKETVDKEMNVKIGYLPENLWKGSPECPILNWLTDALWEAAKQRYPGKVDVAIVNMGGVRDEWPKGDLTFGHIFKVMPFENQLVVLTLTGEDMIELCESFAQYGPQGVAGMRVTIIDNQLADVTIGGKPVDPKKKYKVATSDYLSGGADHMTALSHYSERWNSDVRIRDLYIEAAKAQGTIRAAVDGRMTVK